MRNFYLLVEGRFKGTCVAEAHRGKLVAAHFEQRIASPRDTAAGGRGGRRAHDPVVICRGVDAVTPQLLHAACAGEELRSVLCEFPQRPGDGEE